MSMSRQDLKKPTYDSVQSINGAVYSSYWDGCACAPYCTPEKYRQH